ncbi:MAG: DegT/DnrJ/EryC1/StrS family aminotransferase [Pyrinomonadaceae bacterium]
MHRMPPYFDRDGDHSFPVATRLAATGINLPSSARLSAEDVNRIATTLRQSLRS